MSAPADCPASPFDRYGLRLVEEPAPDPVDPHVDTDATASPPSGLGAFHWSLLAGFTAVQLAYCLALARFVSWAVHHLIGA